MEDVDLRQGEDKGQAHQYIGRPRHALLPKWECRSQLRMNLVDNTSLLEALIKGSSRSRRIEVRNSEYSSQYPSQQSVAAERMGSLSPQPCRRSQPQASSPCESKHLDELIAPKHHDAVNQPSKAEKAEPMWGFWSGNLLSSSAHKCYRRPYNTFFTGTRQHQRHRPANTTAVDNSKSMYMGCAWEESKSKSHIGNLLSAFHYFVPSILANTFSLATK